MKKIAREHRKDLKNKTKKAKYQKPTKEVGLAESAMARTGIVESS